MAKALIDHGGIEYIQIDAGRIGGITAAKAVADYAVLRGVTYVNHTFTTSLALSASLQPYAGLREHTICEFPFEPKPLAETLTPGTAAAGCAGGDCGADDAGGSG